MNDRSRAAKAATTIRNRDIPKLRNVLYRMQEIPQLERAGEWQKDRRHAITRVFSGMPGSTRGVPKGLEAAMERLDEISEEYAQQLVDALDALDEAQDILNGISDKRLRTFVVMAYIGDLSAKDVQQELNLTAWKYRKVREMVEQADSMRGLEWPE